MRILEVSNGGIRYTNDTALIASIIQELLHVLESMQQKSEE